MNLPFRNAPSNPAPASDAERTRVGDWEVDWRSGDLVRGRDVRRLEPKSMDLLRLLVRKRGALTSKTELLQTIWPDEHVGEDVVWRHVHAVRKALDDDANAPTYIENIPRRGYRLIAAIETVSPVVAVEPARPPVALRKRLLFAGLGLSSTLAVAFWQVSAPAAARDYREMLYTSAESHYAAGDPRSLDRAQAALDRVLAEWPEEARAYAGRAAIDTARVHRYSAGATAIERAELEARLAIRMDPALPEAHNALGLAYAIADRYDDAIAAFEQALVLRPEWARPLNNLATVYIWQGRFEEAIAAEERAVQPGMHAGLVPLNLGWANYFLGDLAAAARYAREALTLEPGRPEATALLVRLDLRAGKVAEARLRLSQAVELHPANARLQTLSAMVAHIQGRLPDALEHAARATALDPECRHPPAWARHAALLAETGDRAGATRMAMALLFEIDQGPGDRTGWQGATHQAMAHMVLGDLDEALAVLQAAAFAEWPLIRLDPIFAELPSRR